MNEETPKHWRWREDSSLRPPGPAVIFDLDGVLSDATGRQHFLEGPGKKDWMGFFLACGEDPAIKASVRLADVLDPAVTIVLLTGRPIRVRRLTVDWLERHNVRWDLLIMRPSGDYGAALEFKRKTIGALRDMRYDLRLAFEDDVRNVEMLQAEGVPCVYLHSGYYR